jgi:hypothetical protein
VRAAAIVTIVLWMSAPGVNERRQDLQSAPAAQTDRHVTLHGVLVDAGSGAALPRARVNVTAGRTSAGSVLTDVDGRFSVDVAAGGSLTLRIVKAGYASMTMLVSAAQIRGPDPVRIEVPRGGVIAGRAVDPLGRPAHMITVRRVTPDGISWSAFLLAGGVLETGMSGAPDERGEYRVGGLPPGRYVLEAYPSGMNYQIQNGPSGITVRAVASPFDGSAVPIPLSSVAVDLQPGGEATGVDLLLATAPPPPAGPDPPGGTIRGTVLSTDGSPLADATVMAGPPAAPMAARSARTDAFGRFTLRGIGSGPVAVRASKRGYGQAQPGQRGGDLPGQTLTIEAGKDVDDLSIVLPRLGVISGMVIDEYGEPVQEAAVQLVRVRRQPTGALVGIREQGGYAQQSDDRGQFRLSDILPGDYTVMASLPPETPGAAAALRTVYASAYYPDTSDFASAAPIRIVDGEHIPGLIFTMRRVPVARVTGVAHDSQGRPVTGTIQLMPRNAVTIGIGPHVARPGPGGEFVFADVPPGDYFLRTLVESGSTTGEFATTPLTVADGDPQPVMIRTSRGSRLSGRIVLEGNSGEVLWGYSAGSVAVDPVLSRGSATSVSSPVSTGESFTLSGLAGPTRVRVWSDDQNWYLKSILIDGLDITDVPFDFGFDGRAYSDAEAIFARAATIAGRATDERAMPVRDYAVFVFPTDRDRWFDGSRWVKLARSSADGTFKAASMSPGEYWIAAVDRVDTPGSARISDGSLSASGEWVDAELLTMLSSRATQIIVGEGQSRDVTLRLTRR